MPAERPQTRRAALRIFASSAAQASVLAAIPVAATIAAQAAPTAATEAALEEKLVTLEQMAAAEFDPWEHGEDGWRVPSNEEWMGPFGKWVLPNVRIAHAIMFKTKEELENLTRNLDDDTFKVMVDGIGDARKTFQDFVDVLTGAETRIMCAAASALAKGDLEGARS